MVQYTITVADTGQTAYTAATVTDDFTGILDDVTYNGDAAPTTGTISYARPVLTWTGGPSTDFTTGGGTPVETIPAGTAGYTITSLVTATGSHLHPRRRGEPVR